MLVPVAVVFWGGLLQSTPMARQFHVHNPHNVSVTEVHMVQSAHFDAGCKFKFSLLERVLGSALLVPCLGVLSHARPAARTLRYVTKAKHPLAECTAHMNRCFVPALVPGMHTVRPTRQVLASHSTTISSTGTLTSICSKQLNLSVHVT